MIFKEELVKILKHFYFEKRPVIIEQHKSVFLKPKIVILDVDDIDGFIKRFYIPDIFEKVIVVDKMIRLKYKNTIITLIPSVCDYDTINYLATNIEKIEKINQWHKEYEKKKKRKFKIRYTFQGILVMKRKRIVTIKKIKPNKVEFLYKKYAYKCKRNPSITNFLKWG